MVALVLFVWAVIAAPLAFGIPVTSIYPVVQDDVIGDGSGNRSSCTDSQAESWSYDFHTCFIDRKYADGGRDLSKIIDRILEHASDCIVNSTMGCRPNYRGFLIVMGKMIEQMKDYAGLYLDDIMHGRDKITDLDCVERSLSNETYSRCFESVFEQDSQTVSFERRVESAIFCVNKSHKLCSRRAKSSLNRMARTILGVAQPEKEDIEEYVPPPPPTKRWYEYIFQPFISIWNFMASFFG